MLDGVASNMRQALTIGHDTKIGASASILHDLPPNSVVVGHKGVVIYKKKGGLSKL